jgi:hypothetical protein
MGICEISQSSMSAGAGYSLEYRSGPSEVEGISVL